MLAAATLRPSAFVKETIHQDFLTREHSQLGALKVLKIALICAGGMDNSNADTALRYKV